MLIEEQELIVKTCASWVERTERDEHKKGLSLLCLLPHHSAFALCLANASLSFPKPQWYQYPSPPSYATEGITKLLN